MDPSTVKKVIELIHVVASAKGADEKELELLKRLEETIRVTTKQENSLAAKHAGELLEKIADIQDTMEDVTADDSPVTEELSDIYGMILKAKIYPDPMRMKDLVDKVDVLDAKQEAFDTATEEVIKVVHWMFNEMEDVKRARVGEE